jgi:hypothetical protein
MGKLPPLHPPPPILRYERDYPGELLHIDIKKLGRFWRLGHRVTGNPHQNSDGAGWDFLHVCVDDASRLAYVEIHPMNGATPRRASCFMLCVGPRLVIFSDVGDDSRRMVDHLLPSVESAWRADVLEPVSLTANFGFFKPRTRTAEVHA